MSETPEFFSIQDVVDQLGKLEGRCVSQREAAAIIRLLFGFVVLPDPWLLASPWYTRMSECLRVILEENKIDAASVDPDIGVLQGDQVVPEAAAIAWHCLQMIDENDPQVQRWAGITFGFMVATLCFRAISNIHELLRQENLSLCIRANIARGEQTKMKVLKTYQELKQENPDLAEEQAYTQAALAARVSPDHAARIIRKHLR